ncbi:uncharacterized protein LOC110038167 [Phalaenopsis equestris]|uniref:uncharacterized protein LOC110038167 n=1 Tax=Phalaenopsis equestris TaxID=78828 RepID=UPI0009E2B6AB|nr:uncharacterized protein LOC110038167 [Phalaenopsis equestris]
MECKENRKSFNSYHDRARMDISHLIYADDILLFTRASKPATKCIMECLQHFQQVSGLQAKYSKSVHSGEVNRKVGDSRIWAQMLKAREDIDKLLRWELGQGNINFWKDNWCDNDCLEPLQDEKEGNLLVKDCWVGNAWTRDSISKDIQKYLYRWETYQRNISSRQKHLTPSMLFFAWRVLNNLLPTDDTLELKGLKGPSRCHLCNLDQDTRDHLFFRCNFAKEVWSRLTSHMNINLINIGWENITDCTKDWKGINLMLIPFVVAWFIWMVGNMAKHENRDASATWVMSNCWAYLNKLIHWRKFPMILQTTYMGANHTKIIKVRWEIPPYPFIKINTDESYTNKRAGIGGIFIDHKGKTLLFYKAPYIADDTLETEAAALF